MIIGASVGAVAPTVFAADVLSVARISQTIGVLVAIVAFIVVLSYLARRMPGIAQRGAGSLRTLDGLALSTRDKLVLIEVEGERLLVAVGPAGVQRLHVLGQAPAAPASFASLVTQAAASDTP